MTTVQTGENKLLERPVVASDGTTPFPVASLTSAQVELFCAGRAPVVLVLGTDDELRVSGSSATTLILELTTALTTTLGAGLIRERWTLERPNANFSVDGGTQVDVIELREVTLA